MSKSKIVVQDVIKVIDIDIRSVSKKTVEFLTNYYLSYADTLDTFGEDILNIVTAAEPDAMSISKSPIVRIEIKQLAKLAVKHDACYLRFVKF